MAIRFPIQEPSLLQVYSSGRNGYILEKRALNDIGFKKYPQGKFFDEEAILDELSEKLREVSCALEILQTHERQ